MIVKSCPLLEDTRARIEALNFDLPDIVLNLGDSRLNESVFGSRVILNRRKAVKRCLNKKKMFRIFKANAIPSPEYFDLGKKSDVLKAAGYCIMKREIVLRRGRDIRIAGSVRDFLRRYRDYDYATLKINKLAEWRVIVFRDKIVKVSIKRGSCFALKNANARFEPVYHFSKDAMKLCKRVARIFGIDLCGIDICYDKDAEDFKIIEINSAPGMNRDSVKIFLNYLRQTDFKARERNV